MLEVRTVSTGKPFGERQKCGMQCVWKLLLHLPPLSNSENEILKLIYLFQVIFQTELYESPVIKKTGYVAFFLL